MLLDDKHILHLFILSNNEQYVVHLLFLSFLSLSTVIWLSKRWIIPLNLLYRISTPLTNSISTWQGTPLYGTVPVVPPTCWSNKSVHQISLLFNLGAFIKLCGLTKQEALTDIPKNRIGPYREINKPCTIRAKCSISILYACGKIIIQVYPVLSVYKCNPIAKANSICRVSYMFLMTF